MSCKILSNNKISDKDFLELMIKHHNVAINMSKIINVISTDDYILDYARRIIYNQTQEVNLMEHLLRSTPNIQNDNSCIMDKELLTNKIHELYPDIFLNAKCNDSHFNDSQIKDIPFGVVNPPIQLKNNTNYASINNTANVNTEKFANTMDAAAMTDKEYVDHMVNHHLSGVELAKLVLTSTTEPRILALAQNIILEQEKEMFLLRNLYNCVNYNWRKLV